MEPPRARGFWFFVALAILCLAVPVTFLGGYVAAWFVAPGLDDVDWRAMTDTVGDGTSAYFVIKGEDSYGLDALFVASVGVIALGVYALVQVKRRR